MCLCVILKWFIQEVYGLLKASLKSSILPKFIYIREMGLEY